MSTQTIVEEAILSQLPPSPPALYLRENHVGPTSKADSPVGLELQSLPPPSFGRTASKPDSIQIAPGPEAHTPATPTLATSAPTTPKTPGQIEPSQPSTPHQDRATDIVQSFWNPYMNRFRVVACCMMLIGNGLNDAAPGALLNYIET